VRAKEREIVEEKASDTERSHANTHILKQGRTDTRQESGDERAQQSEVENEQGKERARVGEQDRTLL